MASDIEIDLSIRSPEGAITKVVKVDKYTIVRENPHGLWRVHSRDNGKQVPKALQDKRFTTSEIATQHLKDEGYARA